jgi:hypothetical protein
VVQRVPEADEEVAEVEEHLADAATILLRLPE